MKKATILLTISIAMLVLASCSKKDCVCTITTTAAGQTATTSETYEGISSVDCDAKDYSATGGAISTAQECELE